MKLLHSADLHLDSPFSGLPEDQARFLKAELLKVPAALASLCLSERCDLVLLSGDLFDGPCTRKSLDALRDALAEMIVPVFIAPGNHDFCDAKSPYLTESWPENVRIFKKPFLEYYDLPELSCRVYGAGFTSMDAPAMLKGFHAEGENCYKIAVLHGDPTSGHSPYCPITTAQVTESGLDYLALGHIHKGNGFQAGNSLCAWPGCPMGRGFDETGVKGALIVTFEDTVETRFQPLNTPRFYDLEANASGDCAEALKQVLPPAPTCDFYRVTLTGEAEKADEAELRRLFPHIAHLEIRNRTMLPIDLWANAGEDSMEGTYFRILKEAMEKAPDAHKDTVRLAARISRQILAGQEVELP